MFRTYPYSALYLLCLGIYIFSGQSESVEGAIFLTFLISTLVYTFSSEKLPSKEIQKYPEAYNFKANRMNYYGYGMLSMLIITSILIAVNINLKLINQTSLILLIWPVIIIGSRLLYVQLSKKQAIDNIQNFLEYKYQQNVDPQMIRWILKGIQDEHYISRVPNNVNWGTTQFIRETRDSVLEYLNASKNIISSKEIDNAGDQSK